MNQDHQVENLPDEFMHFYRKDFMDTIVLALRKKNMLEAWSWRQELFAIQQMLNCCILFCFSQEKPVLFENGSKESKRIEQSFFLNFGFILAQALIDKVQWQLKEFFEIEIPDGQIKWKPIYNFLKEKANSDINIGKILELLGEFNRSDEHRIIETRANDIKHSWTHHYFGVKYKIDESNYGDTKLETLDESSSSFMKMFFSPNSKIRSFIPPTGKPTANIEDDIVHLNDANTKLVALIREINKILFRDIAKLGFY
jgi:hypothetical protein